MDHRGHICVLRNTFGLKHQPIVALHVTILTPVHAKQPAEVLDKGPIA